MQARPLEHSILIPPSSVKLLSCLLIWGLSWIHDIKKKKIILHLSKMVRRALLKLCSGERRGSRLPKCKDRRALAANEQGYAACKSQRLSSDLMALRSPTQKPGNCPPQSGCRLALNAAQTTRSLRVPDAWSVTAWGGAHLHRHTGVQALLPSPAAAPSCAPSPSLPSTRPQPGSLSSHLGRGGAVLCNP